MNHRYAVLGLGKFGEALSLELTRLGCEVLAVDRSPAAVEAIRDKVAMSAVADVRNRDAMEELFHRRFDGAVIAMGGSLESTLLAALHLQELKVPWIAAEAASPDAEEVLKRVGVQQAFSPERDSGRRMARRLLNPNMLEFVPLIPGYSVVEVRAPAWMHGKTLQEIGLRRKWNVAAIVIRTAADELQMLPAGDALVQAGDSLTVVGRDDDLAKLGGSGA